MSLEKIQEFETFLLCFQDIKREQTARVEDFKSAFQRLTGWEYYPFKIEDAEFLVKMYQDKNSTV